MTYGEVYNKVLFFIWGDTTPPVSSAGILQGANGLISKIQRQIQVQNDLWFMDKSATISISSSYALSAGIAIGSTVQNVANDAFSFYINNTEYSQAANAVGTALDGDSVPANTYGAWRLEIGVNGTVDIIEAIANVTGYATAALAVAGLPVLQFEHAEMGYVTAMDTSGAFVPGTTALDSGTVTEAFIDSSVTERTDSYLFNGVVFDSNFKKEISLQYLDHNDDYTMPLQKKPIGWGKENLRGGDDSADYPFYYEIGYDSYRKLKLLPSPRRDSILNVRYYGYLDSLTDATFDTDEDEISIQCPYLIIYKTVVEMCMALDYVEKIQVFNALATAEENKLIEKNWDIQINKLRIL